MGGEVWGQCNCRVNNGADLWRNGTSKIRPCKGWFRGFPENKMHFSIFYISSIYVVTLNLHGGNP